MAARLHKGTIDLPWDQSVRKKIRTSMLVNRLEDHVDGKCDMSKTQVMAALGLLRKTLPDLATIEHRGSVALGHYVISDTPQELSQDEWAKRHTNGSGQTVN